MLLVVVVVVAMTVSFSFSLVAHLQRDGRNRRASISLKFGPVKFSLV